MSIIKSLVVLVAAIAAAIEALWPKAGPAIEREPSHTTWRFSGRWWNDSAVTRRTRPGF